MFFDDNITPAPEHQIFAANLQTPRTYYGFIWAPFTGYIRPFFGKISANGEQTFAPSGIYTRNLLVFCHIYLLLRAGVSQTAQLIGEGFYSIGRIEG
ncbi:MAG: hypothetical protein DRJ64_07370 [Thermoprotei archaeon]|nr:MAG: hypothetical protein DRJ64_07370 [Thermoprotei archaeon]